MKYKQIFSWMTVTVLVCTLLTPTIVGATTKKAQIQLRTTSSVQKSQQIPTYKISLSEAETEDLKFRIETGGDYRTGKSYLETKEGRDYISTKISINISQLRSQTPLYRTLNHECTVTRVGISCTVRYRLNEQSPELRMIGGTVHNFGQGIKNLMTGYYFSQFIKIFSGATQSVSGLNWVMNWATHRIIGIENFLLKKSGINNVTPHVQKAIASLNQKLLQIPVIRTTIHGVERFVTLKIPQFLKNTTKTVAKIGIVIFFYTLLDSTSNALSDEFKKLGNSIAEKPSDKERTIRVELLVHRAQ